MYPTEYDLLLSADVNSQWHVQWYNFAVRGMRAGVDYKFNILNFEKPSSTYSYGQQPLVFSEVASLRHGPSRVPVLYRIAPPACDPRLRPPTAHCALRTPAPAHPRPRTRRLRDTALPDPAQASAGSAAGRRYGTTRPCTASGRAT